MESKSKDKIIIYKGHRIRLFKYIADNTIFVCATNIFNHDICYLKNLYKLRWTVEDGFKVFKSNLQLKYVHSKTTEHLHQELIIREILFIVNKLIKTSIFTVKNNKNISLKLIIDSFVNDFHIWLIDIDKIFKMILNYQFITYPNRKRRKYLKK
jgi:IS4 transposase